MEHAIEDISGIPITLEWLIKFGFDKPEGYYYKGPLTGGMTFCFEEKNETLQLSIGLNGNSELDEFENNPIYLHQLQNIYFSLAGGELTIKESTA